MARRRKRGSKIRRWYKKATRNKKSTGLLLAFIGFFAAMSTAGTESPVFYIGIGVMVVGLIMFYFSLRTAYCQSCGQRLGKLPKQKCSRCGSNRIERRDPGASGVAPSRRYR